MRSDPATHELVLVDLHPGVAIEQVLQETGWPLKVADRVGQTESPTAHELHVLRDLHERTVRAHGTDAGGE